MPQFDLTPEQAQLILKIVSSLASDYIAADEENGEGYICKYCKHPLGRYVNHEDACMVPLVNQLRQTIENWP